MHPVGQEVIRLDETGSTNTLVLETPAWLERPGLVVVAHHQTAGRGRVGRRWASVPAVQLQFTAVLHPRLAPDDLGASSLVTGLAVAEAIEAETGLHPRLKWPNDVTCNRRKVCGILIESRTGPDGGPRLAVGIGLNANGTPDDFPADLRDRLTTLRHEAGAAVDTESLLRAVLARLEMRFTELEGGGRPALLASWMDRADLAGRRVRVPQGKARIAATAEGLDASGALRVRTDAGDQLTIGSGEVEWLE